MTFSPDLLLNALPGVAYATDLDGRLSFIARDAWQRFAAENGAPAMADVDSLIGTPLATHMDAVSYGLVDSLLQLAADGRAPRLSYDYRCDAPTVDREMRMQVSTLHEAGQPPGLIFQSTVVAEYHHRHVGLLDMPVQMDPSLPILRMCSYCKRVEHPTGSGDWLAPISYEDAGGSTDVRISHGICPDCERDIVEPLLSLRA